MLKEFGTMVITRKGKITEKYEIGYGYISFEPSIDLFLLGYINSKENMGVIELGDKFNIILSELEIDIGKFDYGNIDPYENGVYTFEFNAPIGDKFCECIIDDAWISGFTNIKEMKLKTRANSKLIINELK